MKRICLLVISFFYLSACLMMASHYLPMRSPRQITLMFMRFYGTAKIKQLAPYTTTSFRDDKSEENWAVDTQRTLEILGYQHVIGIIVEEQIKGDKAIVKAKSVIRTLAGAVKQKEIYCFVKTKEGWKLDDLIVGGEKFQKDEYRL